MSLPTEPADGLASDEFVIRFVHTSQYDSSAAEGSRVRLANLRRDEFQPREKHQPSVYLESRCSVAQIEAANPKWTRQAVLRIRIGDLRKLELEVVRSPSQCPFETIREAHASILGVTSENRESVIALFGRSVVRPPA
jgi:hypothetical protein